MKYLSIDIETYSSENLAKCGVYRYCQSPDFEVLLFGYSADGGPVKVIDLANGETIPDEILCALVDDKVIKWAFNAQFERICLSRYLGGSVGTYMDPSSWQCTMVWAATLGLPLSLEGVGAVLGLEKQKLKEGKDLIRYFCTPAKTKDGSTFRRFPADAPDKWEAFKAYNLRDVETEMAIQDKLSKFPVAESEWRNYHLDQQINDRGIMLDMTMVRQAIACDDQFKRTHMEQARSVTGLENPNSPAQLKEWLAERGVEAESLSKAAVLQMLEEADGEVELALSMRQELAKSSVKKYTAMEAVVGTDSRARGLIQFYGANRTGRYAGRLIQVQNLPQNHLPDLDTVRSLIRSGQFDTVELLYDSVPMVLSELIRTAFVPKPGHVIFIQVVEHIIRFVKKILHALSGHETAALIHIATHIPFWQIGRIDFGSVSAVGQEVPVRVRVVLLETAAYGRVHIKWCFCAFSGFGVIVVLQGIDAILGADNMCPGILIERIALNLCCGKSSQGHLTIHNHHNRANLDQRNIAWIIIDTFVCWVASSISFQVCHRLNFYK